MSGVVATLSVILYDDDRLVKVSEVLTRAAVGLTMEGMDANVSFTVLEEEDED